METDYSTVTQSVFEEVVKNYAIFRLLGGLRFSETTVDDDDDS